MTCDLDRRPQRDAGFSLIELMAAMVIFAIIAVIAQRSMTVSMIAADRISNRSTSIAELQLAVSQVTRDLENLVPRAIRTGSDAPEPAIVLENDGQVLTFTRGGIDDPTGRARSPFQRVIYVGGAPENEPPRRGTWDQVDRPAISTPRLSPLTENIAALSFAVYSDGQWIKNWPSAGETNPAILPDGIAVTFETRLWGPVRRVVSFR